MKRRAFLSAGIGMAGAALIAPLRAASGRAVIVGGGWGGLAAARRLRTLAPELDVVLVEKHAIFRSRPLSNRWLVGLAEDRLLQHDYQAAAKAHGYRFLRAEVTEIDRAARRVATRDGVLAYDWLIVAAGIREDFSPWYDVDRSAGDFTRQHFPSAFADHDGILRLKAKLENFKGGDLLMSIPPTPYRCPPAPYERAGMIAWWLKTRRIKGRLVILDPNQPALSFDRVFRDTYREQVAYLPQARIKTLDPYRKQVVTEFETIDFADAILMPPQQAADIAWQAGLVARGSDWAAIDPVHLHLADDERVFLVGDLIDKASPLFGHYPKTGQLAARLGQIAAQQIAARAAGRPPEKQLPDSACYVLNRVEPMEMARIETSYRFRGDGLIQQTVRQGYNPQPENEDVQWAKRMFAELGFPTAA